MKKLVCFLWLTILIFQMGCTQQTSGLTKETYPRVDGSTATLPLSQDIAAHLLEISLEEAQELVQHNKTNLAYQNLLYERADIIFVTEPSEEELALAEKAGVELEIVPIVRDAFVFLVNEQNPVAGLTLEEIQKIYMGQLTNWQEVKGPDLEIVPFQRNQDSGSQTLMENMVMKDLPLMEPPVTQVSLGMGGMIDQIAGFDNGEAAIGYSVYYFANQMYVRENVRFLEVDGFAPTQETISRATYPLTMSYYAVLRKSEPKDSPARKLLQWVLSKAGQELAEKSGYVPLP